MDANNCPKLFDNLALTEGLITAKAVANALNVSVQTVYVWAKTKRIPCIVLGRCVRFRPKDIREILSGHQDFEKGEVLCL